MDDPRTDQVLEQEEELEDPQTESVPMADLEVDQDDADDVKGGMSDARLKVSIRSLLP